MLGNACRIDASNPADLRGSHCQEQGKGFSAGRFRFLRPSGVLHSFSATRSLTIPLVKPSGNGSPMRNRTDPFLPLHFPSCC